MSMTMKDSGIPWIGIIPTHWDIRFIKQIMRNKSIKGYPNETVLSLYREYGVVPKDSRDDNHNVTSEDTSGYKLVDKGDFVINKMKAWQGSMAVSDYRGIISPAYYVCRFIAKDINRRYIHYLLRNDSYKDEYMRLSTGLRIGQWDLNIDDFLRIQMVVPSLPEQNEIAAILDKKCAEIDKAISLQEKMIDELTAFQYAIIGEVTTKGLNPRVHFVESGIDWVGDMPSHWRITTFKEYGIESEERNKGNKTSELLALSYSLGVTLYKDKIYNKDRVKNDYEEYKIVRKDDLVLSPNDIIKGSIFVSRYDGCISPMYLIFHPRNPQTHSFRYLSYLLRNKSVGRKFFFMARGMIGEILDNGKYVTRRMTVTKSDITGFKVLLPPPSEQKMIVDYLDTKCSEIDALIAIKQSKIETLKEYKKSIIYEYVTGKKGVEA